MFIFPQDATEAMHMGGANGPDVHGPFHDDWSTYVWQVHGLPSFRGHADGIHDACRC